MGMRVMVLPEHDISGGGGGLGRGQRHDVDVGVGAGGGPGLGRGQRHDVGVGVGAGANDGCRVLVHGHAGIERKGHLSGHKWCASSSVRG